MRRGARVLPTFLFIGADKTGSTWLHRILLAHPRCFVPPCKDIYFFDRYFERGFEWYASFFRKTPADATAIGELSHDYLYSEAAAERIATLLPGVRLVVFLRNPVERTFSEYLYLVRSGLTRLPLREALEQFPEAVDHSRYAQHLEPYFDRFDRSQIGTFLTEDLRADPRAFAAGVLAHLGLDFVEQLAYEDHVLPAGKPRSAVLARLARGASTLTRDLGFPGLVGRVRESTLARLLYVPYSESERPRLSDSDRDWLWAQLGDDLPRLEQLLGRDLSCWTPRDPSASDLADEAAAPAAAARR
jgi:sulfotransferase family protein